MNKYPYFKTCGVATLFALSALFSDVGAQSCVDDPSRRETLKVHVDNKLYHVRVINIMGDEGALQDSTENMAFGVSVYDSLNVGSLTSLVNFIESKEDKALFWSNPHQFIKDYIADEIQKNPKRFKLKVMEPRP